MPRIRRRLEDRGKVSDGFLTEASKLVSKGFKDYIRNRLYRTISPITDYNLRENAKAFLEGRTIQYDDIEPDNKGRVFIEVGDGNMRLDVVDDIYGKYLQIPENERNFKTRVQPSKYKPTKGDKSETYYKLPLEDYEQEYLIDETNDLPINGNKLSYILGNYNLAHHTIGRGFDNKGEYRSYYDRFDLNPFNGKYNGTKIPVLDKLNDVSLGIGKPVNIYDRIYLDDYYGVPQTTHGVYLPEVTVRGKRSLKNRGK